jgi:hypothetical protein
MKVWNKGWYEGKNKESRRRRLLACMTQEGRQFEHLL